MVSDDALAKAVTADTVCGYTNILQILFETKRESACFDLLVYVLDRLSKEQLKIGVACSILHAAAYTGARRILSYLLKRFPDCASCEGGGQGRTVAMYSTSAQTWIMLALTQEQLMAQNDNGETLLHYAAKKSIYEKDIDYLLDVIPDALTVAALGRPPITVLQPRFYGKFLQRMLGLTPPDLLLAKRHRGLVTPSEGTSFTTGSTLLHEVVRGGNSDLVAMVLHAIPLSGIDIKDEDGLTAYQVAESSGHGHLLPLFVPLQ
jgi:hypothetical protein